MEDGSYKLPDGRGRFYPIAFTDKELEAIERGTSGDIFFDHNIYAIGTCIKARAKPNSPDRESEIYRLMCASLISLKKYLERVQERDFDDPLDF